jgi:hypothetical protein
MNKLLALLTVGAVAGVAVADVPPPPPPKGQKYVSVSSEVILGKGVSGYTFVQQVGMFPGGGATFNKLDLSDKKATAMAAGGRRRFVNLLAVPQDEAKGFATDDDLFSALKANKVKGAHHIGFPGTATVSDTVKGDAVKWTYTITAIDTKGIKTTVEGEGAPKPTARPEKAPANDSPDEEGAPGAAVAAPRGGMWIAGLAAFAGLLLGGFWLAGRIRHKV